MRNEAEPPVYLGTSGWAYASWKPGFYPATVPARSFLEHYATQLNSVEVNHTFRALPTAKQLEGWLAAVPTTFRFSFKAPQRITHFQRLRASEATAAEFITALDPVHAAGQLGPLLFQLPPNFPADNERLAAFLGELRSSNGGGALQLAFEFRHDSWLTDATYALLQANNTALCIADDEERTTPDIVTADLRCYRLRRPGGYPPAERRQFAAAFAAAAKTTPVYTYLRHEDEPTGPLQAAEILTATRRGGTR